MNKNRKADATNTGSKTDLTANQIQTFSIKDHSTSLGDISPIIDRIVTPCPFPGSPDRGSKIHKLYICFVCDQCFPVDRMSSMLAICRGCLHLCRRKGRIARRNEIDRVLNSIRIFLRGRLDSV